MYDDVVSVGGVVYYKPYTSIPLRSKTGKSAIEVIKGLSKSCGANVTGQETHWHFMLD